jgi:hypothetical protein
MENAKIQKRVAKNLNIGNMKRKSSIKTSLAAIAMAVFLLTGCEKEQFIQSSDLPREISTYILTHFPDNTILQAVIERDGLTKTYNIILSENISLEFNRKKEIIDIDSETKLPDSVIPAKILQYVTTNYPDNFITDWELDNKNQQVQLNNGLDLEFNMNGDFLRIDD